MKKHKKTKRIVKSIVIIMVLLLIIIKGINKDFTKGNAYVDDNNNFQYDYPKLNPWSPQITFSVGTYPVIVSGEDANNDGFNDIVTANYGDDTVSVILWNDTIGDWDPQITKQVGFGPWSVFVGDANNDGFNDIITANEGDDEVSILLWNNTVSDWNSEITRSVGYGPEQVVIKDANNDGKNDIINSNIYDDTVSILLWNTTIDNWDSQITKSVGDYPGYVFVGDANNDGFNDIITSNNGDDEISILLWNNTLDDWDVEITKSVGSGPTCIFIADLNNDGSNDIITVDLFSNSISLFLWNDTLDNWNARLIKTVGNEPALSYVNDVNNDGLNDIVVSNYGDDTISIMLWNTTTSNWDSTITKPVGDSPGGIFIADANNDGLNDILVANLEAGTISLYTYYLNWIFIEIIDQSFSDRDFNITFSLYNTKGKGIDLAQFQMWWNGTDVTSNIQNLENGYYRVTLDPITVLSNEDPILLNMTISASGYEDRYFETYIAVEPSEIIKYLQIEITEHFYSFQHFNFTFFVCDEMGQGIASATFRLWWNGVDVSTDVENIDDGFYFVSLDRIVVYPYEDPILLNMTISASGYEDRYFETYIAVDPHNLKRDSGIPITPLWAILLGSLPIIAFILLIIIAVMQITKKRRAR